MDEEALRLARKITDSHITVGGWEEARVLARALLDCERERDEWKAHSEGVDRVTRRMRKVEREKAALIQRNRELHRLNARLSGHTLAHDLAAAIEALKDARSFVISIQRNEGRWENAATGILSRIDAALDKLKGGDNVIG